MNKKFEHVSPCDVNHIANQVESTLRVRLGQDSAPWHTELVSRQASHGGTVVFSAVSAVTGQKVAAKVYLRRHLAEAEFRAAKTFQTAQAPVAQALFADGPTGLVVSQWQAGTNVSDILEHGDGTEAVVKAGEWLRGLHAARQGTVKLYHPMRFLVDLCIAANGMAGALLPGERDDFTRALSATARKAALSLPGLYRPVHLHGDFLPQNLIMTPGGTVAVDLLHTRIGSRLDDLASMTVNLALRSRIGTLGSVSAEDARRMFLSAYGLKGSNALSRLWQIERVELLKRWQYFGNETFPNRENGLAMVRIIQSIFRERGWYQQQG